MATEQKTPGAARPAMWVFRWVGALAAMVITLGATQPLYAGNGPTDTPEWLEPRGLSVVDLVDLVPEEHLAGSIVSFAGGGGIVQYVSGQRSGDTVTINTNVFPQLINPALTIMNCLGQSALFDSWPVAVPGAEMRVFDGTTEVTDEIIGLEYVPAGLLQPNHSAQTDRYDRIRNAPVERTSSGALILPANMGCVIYVDGIYATLSATFVFTAPQTISVEVLDNETFNFHTYIGHGDAGQLAKLSEQMLTYGDRHDKFGLAIPDGADYVWVKYPPTPVSPYTGVETDTNVQRPSSGTYRLAFGTDLEMSVDHVISQGLPLHAQYLDADFSEDVDYLERLEPINVVASPEYFVPAGIAFDPCMTGGGCPDELLEEIRDATMPLTVYYYRVSRVNNSLTRVPLRQVDTTWTTDDASAASLHPASGEQILTVQVLLPLIAKPEPVVTPPPDDEPEAGCPCGWFDVIGAMLDVTPGLPEN